MATTQSNPAGAPYIDQKGNQRTPFGAVAPKNTAQSMVPPPEKKGFFSSMFGKKSNKNKKQPVQQTAPAQVAPPPATDMAPAPAPVQEQPIAVPPPVQHTIAQQPVAQQPFMQAAPQTQAPPAPIHPDLMVGPPPAEMLAHDARAVEAQMAANMRLVQTEMLDGSVQELPYCVAQQLMDLSLCKIRSNNAPAFHAPVSAPSQPGADFLLPYQAPAAAAEAEVEHIPGYYPQRKAPTGPVSMSAPNLQNSMSHPKSFSTPLQRSMQQSFSMPLPADEMVELEMPDGTIRLIPQSQAQQMGAIPAAVHPIAMPQQTMQMPMPMPQQTMQMPMPQHTMQVPQMQNMPMHPMGNVVEIGPPQVLNGPPIQMGTAQQISHMPPMPVQRVIRQVVQQQQPVRQIVQQHTIMVQNSMAPQRQVAAEPIVQLIMPDGQVQMLPKSQALAIANQIKAQQQSQSMSMPQPVMQQQPMVRSNSMSMVQDYHTMQNPIDFQAQHQDFHTMQQPQDFNQGYQGLDNQGYGYQQGYDQGYPQDQGYMGGYQDQGYMNGYQDQGYMGGYQDQGYNSNMPWGSDIGDM